jgi:hypothetical protein
MKSSTTYSFNFARPDTCPSERVCELGAVLRHLATLPGAQDRLDQVESLLHKLMVGDRPHATGLDRD